MRARFARSRASVCSTRAVTYLIFSSTESRRACIGDSAATISRSPSIWTAASSAPISLMSRALSATSCSRLSRCADARASSLSFWRTSSDGPQLTSAMSVTGSQTRCTTVLCIDIAKTSNARAHT